MSINEDYKIVYPHVHSNYPSCSGHVSYCSGCSYSSSYPSYGSGPNYCSSHRSFCSGQCQSGNVRMEDITITFNKRYTMGNPYPGYEVVCKTEVYHNNIWGEVDWWYESNISAGAKTFHTLPDDRLVLITGNSGIVRMSYQQSNPFDVLKPEVAYSAPCRVKVFKRAKTKR